MGRPNPGAVPIGCGCFYLKSLTGTPALSSEFVECNGQSLSDAQSVYNGVTIPNLNGASAGTKRFLRGSATSGTVSGSETHYHTMTWININLSSAAAGSGIIVSYVYGASSNVSTLPSYYEVVWVMRIK